MCQQEQYVSINSGPTIDLHLARISDSGKPDSNEYVLNDLEVKLFYWVIKGYSLREISKKTGLDEQKVLQVLTPYLKNKVLELSSVKPGSSYPFSRSKEFFLRRGDQETLQSLVRSSFHKYPDNRLLIFNDNETLTYSETERITASVIMNLMHNGIGKGDRIMIYADMNVFSLIVFWAAVQLGIIVVPVDYNDADKVLVKIAEDIKPKMIFCDNERFYKISGMTGCPAVVYDLFENAENDTGTSFEHWLNAELSDKPVLPEVSAGDPGVILYTSGTTGMPKGVVLSQGSLYRSAKAMKEVFCWQEDDVLFCPGGLHAMSGLRNPCVTSLHAGGAVAVQSEQEYGNLFGAVDWIRKSGCTLLSTVPVFIRQMIRFSAKISRESLSSLRSVFCTGAGLPGKLANDFKHEFQLRIINYYGLTETCGLCVSQFGNFTDSSGDSIGLPVDCIAQIVDEQGRPLGTDQNGELRIYSGNLLLDYFHQPALKGEIIRDGWLYTGDYARRRKDRSIVLVGRKKEIIKNIYGDLIYPEEIEIALETHPQVAEAGVCSTAGPDEDDNITAFVVLRQQPVHTRGLKTDLKKHIMVMLGSCRIPAEIIIAESLPRDSNGELLRKNLKQRKDYEPDYS